MKKLTEKKVYRLVLIGALILFILTNIFFSLASARWTLRLDTTANKLYELSTTTLDVLSGLESDTKVYVLENEADFPAVLRELLSRYARTSDKLSIEYIDPYENPVFLDGYMQQGISLSESDILVDGAGGVKRIGYDELLVYSGDSFTGIDLEQKLTSAIIYANSQEHRSVLFTSGHNERSTKSLETLFEGNNYTVSTQPLTQEGYTGADVIVIASPTRDLTESEAAALSAYLSRGGSLMVFLEPGVNDFPLLSGLLAEWNIVFDDDVVFDSRYYVDGNPINIIPLYTTHEINTYFTDNQYFLTVPSCRSITLTAAAGDADAEPVLVSSSYSYAKAGTQYTSTEKETGDAEGSFVLAAASEKKTASGEAARVFAAGSRYIYSDDIMGTESLANSEFLTQAANYLAGSTSGVSIPAKTVGSTLMAVTRGQEVIAGIVLIGLIPVGILAAGITVRVRREKL